MSIATFELSYSGCMSCLGILRLNIARARDSLLLGFVGRPFFAFAISHLVVVVE